MLPTPISRDVELSLRFRETCSFYDVVVTPWVILEGKIIVDVSKDRKTSGEFCELTKKPTVMSTPCAVLCTESFQVVSF